MGFLCWPLRAVLFLVIANAAPPAAQTAATKELLSALEDILEEEPARKVIEPHLVNLKILDAAVVAKVVQKQWWLIAQDIVAKSHLQGADLSFAVRKAVKALKEEADELLRTLNPKYGQATKVAPAFQWAQNDTCIFMTVKFTVRWNAPGALEVTEPVVDMSRNLFNFTGLGKHSNNKYKYSLDLKLFDNIVATGSTWSAGSVGKLSVTMRKAWPRKWPRLLLDKKLKIGNMHVWMETQDRLNGDLGGMSTVSHSPVTCALIQKLYCSVTDTCKAPDTCHSCPGKTVAEEEKNICAGPPTQKTKVSFKDSDMDQHEYGGAIKITSPAHDFESDSYAVFWGKDGTSKIDAAEQAFIGEASAHGRDHHVTLKHNTKIPEGATHFLVFSKNVHGEYANPGVEALKDSFLPLESPKPIEFKDEDGARNELKGDLKIDRYERSEKVTFDKYSLYWGKSATRKIDSPKKNNSAFIADVEKDQKTYFVRSSIPEHATHFLLYTKNEHGENPTPAAVHFVDNIAPCEKPGNDDCPVGVTVVPSGSTHTFSVQRAKSEAGLVAYTLYWGRGPCTDAGDHSLNGHLKYLPINESLEYELPADVEVPDDTTHVLAFSQNALGESKFCVSESFVRATPSAEPKPEL